MSDYSGNSDHYMNDTSHVDNHSEEEEEEEEDIQIYKTKSRTIKAVRVELDYSSPTTEQAPKSRLARQLVGADAKNNNEGTTTTTTRDHQRRTNNHSDPNTKAIHNLRADRKQSFTEGKFDHLLPTRGGGNKTKPKATDNNNNNNNDKKKKKSLTFEAQDESNNSGGNNNKKNPFGRIPSRNKLILKESNFSDAEAAAANPGSPSQFSFLLATMLTGVSTYYMIALVVILVWTCFWTWFIEERLRKSAEQDGDETAQQWLTWLDEADVRVIGALFTFSLVFRFNQCYNRWWQGRMLWGEIIQNCLDFSRKVTLWCLDTTFADRMNRYIVCFPYAAKAQLRGLSLCDASESGALLVERGFMTQEELDFLKDNPCWEPEFFLDLMRATVALIIRAQWEREPDEQVLLLPHSNRIHDRLFPPMDKAIYDLGNSIGEGVSVRSAGLPRSYDTVHHIFFWIYFMLAPPCEAATIGWLAPLVLGFSACIIMTLMDMGTAMVDPFGTDLVDLPIERFCETIEAQVMTISRRHKTGKILEFAQNSTPCKQFHADDNIFNSHMSVATKISLSH